MTFSLNIVLRGKTYWFRKAVPKSLRPVIGLTEWTQSLHTSDPAIARQRAHVVALRVEKILADAKRTASPENAARAWKTALLREDLQDRIQRPRSDDDLETESQVIADELEKVTAAVASHPTPMNLARRDAFQEVLRRLDGSWTPSQTEEDEGISPSECTAWSKWYGRWARRIVADRRKVFHSWRHLVEDRLRDAGVPEDQRDALLGHSSSRMGRRYGAGFGTKVLLEAVKRISY